MTSFLGETPEYCKPCHVGGRPCGGLKAVCEMIVCTICTPQDEEGEPDLQALAMTGIPIVESNVSEPHLMSMVTPQGRQQFIAVPTGYDMQQLVDAVDRANHRGLMFQDREPAAGGKAPPF